MNNVLDVTKYQPKSKDKFILDANIWLYLYCPLGDYRKTAIRKYDGFLKRAINSNASIFVSSLILSEVINRWLRLDFNVSKKGDMDFKRDYRPTTICKSLCKNISGIIQGKIFQIAGRIDDNFSGIDATLILNNMVDNDFNDVYHGQLANMNSLVIVTDDADFGNINVPLIILTGNPKLLSKAN